MSKYCMLNMFKVGWRVAPQSHSIGIAVAHLMAFWENISLNL